MITTEEIAKKAGVSRGTVSRVINNNPNVNKETRVRIQKIIDEANYIPNEAARSLVMRKSLKIAFVTFSKPFDFWNEIRKGYDSARKELLHTGIEIVFIETDIEEPYEQVNVIDRVIEEKYNGVVLCPNNPSIMYTSLYKLKENNIPVVLYNVDMPKYKCLAFVGCDHFRSGKLAGEFFKKMYYNRKGKIAIFTLEDYIEPIEERVNGFLSVVNNCPNIEIVEILKFERDGYDLQFAFEEVYKIKKIDGLFLTIAGLECVGEKMHNMNIHGNFILLGYDLNNEVRKYIEKECITATITHEPIRQSYEAIYILYNYLSLGKTPKIEKNYTKLEIIMDNNS